MANYEDNYSNAKVDWALPFQRTDSFPLDRSSIFSSLEDAINYSKGDGTDSRELGGTSYIGQIITVYQNDNVDVYKIVGTGNLEKVGNGLGTLISDTYTNALNLATKDNIGQIIYCTNDDVDEEDPNKILFSKGPYMVIGEKSLSKLSSTAPSEDVNKDLESLKTEINKKQDKLINSGDGQNIKTINKVSILGSGDINTIGKIDTTSTTTAHGEIFNDYTNNKATGKDSHAEGGVTTASGSYSHAEGANTIASGSQSHAEGNASQSKANGAHAEGGVSIAFKEYSHAEGYRTNSSGKAAHSEGESTHPIPTGLDVITAKNEDIIKKWNTTKFNLAKGESSHTEGKDCLALGNYSHAEGQETTASGIYSHVEGFATVASSSRSHAEGNYTIASGYNAHSEGTYTIAENYCQHSQGYFNTKEITPSPTIYNATKTAFAIGNGTSDTKRSDAVNIKFDGTTYINKIGDFNGTNPTETNSLQAVMKNHEHTLNKTLTQTKIPVAGGPLAGFVKNKYPNGIPEGTSMQTILMDLFCEEKWPTISYVNANLSSSVSSPSISMSTNTVEVGTSVSYSVSCGTSNYTTTPNSADGFTYGYSDEDKDGATKVGTKLTGTVSSVTTTSSTRKLTVSGFISKEETGVSPTISGNRIAVYGSNSISATNTSHSYSCDFGAIDSKYIISNLGNTKGHKSNSLGSLTKTTEVKTSTSISKSFDATYYAFVGYVVSVPTTSTAVRAMQNNTKLGKGTIGSSKCTNTYMVVAVPTGWDFTIKNGMGQSEQRDAFVKTNVDVKLPNGTLKSYDVWSTKYLNGEYKDLIIK